MVKFRKIIHIDMDCFYAAVEERDRPEYRGKPLAVGGSADRRGVLCTCNYVAGVGKVTAQKMHQQGMMTCRDVQSYTCSELQHQWGKLGQRLYELCQGIDERPVEPNRIRRSLSVEQTFPADLPDPRSARIIVEELFQTLQTRLSSYDERPIRQQFVKIKFYDFTQTTIECMSQYVDLAIFHRLLDSAFLRGQKPMRLIGLGVRFRETARSAENSQQISLSCL